MSDLQSKSLTCILPSSNKHSLSSEVDREKTMLSKQLERLMRLHIMISDGQYPSSRTIHEYFKVTTRTAYRDIQTLRNLFKAPLSYDHIKHGYYYTKENWNLFERREKSK